MFFKKIIKMMMSNSNTDEYLNNGAILLDVRTEAEFSDGHHPKSVNIPLQVLKSRLNELDHKKAIVTVCRSGARSAQAAIILREKGFDAINGGPWNLI